MKTIFINIPSKLEVRNYLRGDFYNLLMDKKDLRVVAFVDPKELDAIKSEFGSEICIIEPMPDYVKFGPSFLQSWQLFVFASIPTSTIRVRQRYAYLRGGKWISYFAKGILNFLGRFKIHRFFIKFVEFNFIRDDRAWNEMFVKYKPDLVFGTSLTLREDTSLIKAAKRHRVKTAGMTRSWDNLTSKLFLGVFPDLLLVQNPTLKEEAVKIYDYPEEKIRITGFQQWSHYRDENWVIPKPELSEMLGLDPNKKWITYFSGPPFTQVLEQKDYGEHLVMLKRAIKSGKLPDVQLIAKVHPIDEVYFLPEISDVPVLRFGKQFNFKVDDMKLLVNLLRYTDVMVNFSTSVTIEAAIMDVPIISLGFNGYKDAEVPFEGRLDVAYKYTAHVQKVLASGGVKVVYNEKDYIKAVNECLADKEKDKDGRARLVDAIAGPVDGKAGERIVSALSELL